MQSLPTVTSEMEEAHSLSTSDVIQTRDFSFSDITASKDCTASLACVDSALLNIIFISVTPTKYTVHTSESVNLVKFGQNVQR